MASTLYRKYRPQTFATVVNQQHIRLTLTHALEQERLAHAYLFTGPRGVGKTTIARILARAASCQKRGKGSDPCDDCPSCTSQLDGSSLDVVEIDAASQTGVDNVRENIIQSARVTPALGKYKVFIIDEVHMLSLAAFNALLKLLEEPPAHALFILATTEVHRVPETIISRTQRFDFKKLTIPDMAKRLEELAKEEKRNLADGVAERIARAAAGSMRDAESMLGQLFSFEEKTIDQDIADLVLPRSDDELVRRLAASLVGRQTTEALNQFHAYCDDGGDIPVLVHQLVNFARTLMLASVDPTLLKQVMADQDQKFLAEAARLADQAPTSWFIMMTETLLEAERQLIRAQLEELPVEIAIVKITAGESAEPPAVHTPAPSSKLQANTKPPTPTKVPTSRSTKKTSGTLNLASAQQAWATVQGQLSGLPSLRISVQHAHVKSTEDGLITVAVPFALHRDRLMDNKSHPIIVEHLTEALGHPVKFTVVLGEERPAQPPAPATPPAEKPKPATNGTQSKTDLWDQVVASFS